jgi:hypothetical protein
MMRVGWLLVLCGACFDPTYDSPRCSDRGECPSGFECDLSSNVCESRASGPDAPRIDAAVGGDSALPSQMDAGIDGTTTSTLCTGEANAIVCLPFDGDFENQAEGRAQAVTSLGTAPTYGTGAVDVALQVTTSRLEVAPTFSLSGPSTLEAFVAPTAPGADKWIVDHGNRGMFLNADNELVCRFGTLNLVISGALPTNAFTHVACVTTGDQIRIYKNGSRAMSIGNTPAGSTGTLSIAAKRDGTLGFTGRIDELRVFDVARSDTQVMQAAGR